jgi:hypothetical protein
MMPGSVFSGELTLGLISQMRIWSVANGVYQIGEGFLAFLKSFSDGVLDQPAFHIDRLFTGCRWLDPSDVFQHLADFLESWCR